MHHKIFNYNKIEQNERLFRDDKIISEEETAF